MKIMEEVITMLDSYTKRKKFEKICKMPQAHLKKYLAKELKKTHKEIKVDDGFVYAQGTFPVLLVAHMDTVHNQLPDKIVYMENNNIISSPNGIGGDDRCGVYMILEVVKRFNCSVLFCEDEEIGCIGASKFTENKFAGNLNFNYMIEFDRKGDKDAVFYDCDNPEFTKFICKDFYVKDWGSCSDISELAPFFGVAAVNLSCGYYGAHTTKEFVVFSHMERSIEEACKILERTTEEDVFEYIPAKNRWGYGSNYAGYYSGYGIGNYGTAWYDDDDFYYDGNGYGNEMYDNKGSEIAVKTYYYLIEFKNLDGNLYEYEVTASSTEEAIGMFCIDHPLLSYSHVTGILDDSEPYM